MLTAEEALSKTLDSLKEVSDKEMLKIETLINDAVSKGKFSILFESMTDITRYKLRDLGYIINNVSSLSSYGSNNIEYRISWRETMDNKIIKKEN